MTLVLGITWRPIITLWQAEHAISIAKREDVRAKGDHMTASAFLNVRGDITFSDSVR